MQEVDAEEEHADNDFWKQDFFAEGNQDVDYSTESEDADVPDSDFDAAVSDDDADGEANEDAVRKVMKAKKGKESVPGWKQAVRRRAALRRAARKRDEGDGAPGDGADNDSGASMLASWHSKRDAPHRHAHGCACGSAMALGCMRLRRRGALKRAH